MSLNGTCYCDNKLQECFKKTRNVKCTFKTLTLLLLLSSSLLLLLLLLLLLIPQGIYYNGNCNFACKELKFGQNTLGLIQWHFRNFSTCSTTVINWLVWCQVFVFTSPSWHHSLVRSWTLHLFCIGLFGYFFYVHSRYGTTRVPAGARIVVTPGLRKREDAPSGMTRDRYNKSTTSATNCFYRLQWNVIPKFCCKSNTNYYTCSCANYYT